MAHCSAGGAPAALKTTKYTEEAQSDSDDAFEPDNVGTSGGTNRDRDDSEDDEEAWSEPDDKPAKKRARTTTTAKGKGKGKGRTGKLSYFQSCPMDVLVEIARHLDPLTLLNMSRANKQMHSVFASRSASAIWGIVRRNVYLPDLTAPDVTEMQYASLTFEKNCHICGRGRASIVDYALRIRWCKDCQRANLMQANKVEKQLDFLDDAAISCSLTTTHNVSGSNWTKKPYYCKRDVEKVSNQLDSLKDDIAAAKGKTERNEASAALDAFIKERKEIIKAAQVDAAELRKWESSSASMRKEASNDARKARRDAIKQRLLDLGWDDQDIEPMWSIHSLVDQPTKLTDLIWNKISAQVIDNCKRNKERRLENEAQQHRQDRREKVEPFYKDLLAKQDAALQEVYPSFGTFSQLPSVKDFWYDVDSGIDDESWATALPAVKEDVNLAVRVLKVRYARGIADALVGTRLSVPSELLKKLEAPPPKVDDAGDPVNHRYYASGADYSLRVSRLDLDDHAPDATDAELDSTLSRFAAVFRCTAYSCKTILPYPAIYAHVCAHGNPGTLVSPASKGWLDALVKVLDLTMLEDNVASIATLQALGAVWDCNGCHASLVTGAWYWRQPQPKCTELTWDELASHWAEYHNGLLNRTAVPTVELRQEGYRQLIAAGKRSVEGRDAEADKVEAGSGEKVGEEKPEQEGGDERLEKTEVVKEEGSDGVELAADGDAKGVAPAEAMEE